MAKNTGNGHRIGAVRDRSQTQTPAGNWVKRDRDTGRFIDQKADKQPFKGVTRERGDSNDRNGGTP
ncbi:MAG: hypothetical protein IV100_25410 [Myxococcales bacterium]|nr:hypothetical protein [Myxococcales bacterium]